MKGIVMTPEEFRELLAEKQIHLSNYQMEQFDNYYKMLVEWNEKMNLTAITERNEVYLKHFYDSLTLAFEADFTEARTLCDVGSGAGFPSIPLKIAFPDLQITIVDSLNKRITFLSELTKKLKIEANLYHDRAETFGQNPSFRATFDFVTARAVARLNVLSELCLPLVKMDGFFYAMKAAKSEEEISEAKHAIAILGGKLIKESALTLPKIEDQRHIIAIQKKKPTPKKYPRKPGMPNKQPM
ncbi:16S rRNA methyltransferase GidB [Enterococcus faecalis 13-SD-W-01]|nr:16S rRNA methyltransferase GidB [Enterococcus faecalis 13-SD-W-01]